MTDFQLSQSGKTSWEVFYQMTGWIIGLCYSLSQISKFQCLLLDVVILLAMW